MSNTWFDYSTLLDTKTASSSPRAPAPRFDPTVHVLDVERTRFGVGLALRQTEQRGWTYASISFAPIDINGHIWSFLPDVDANVLPAAGQDAILLDRLQQDDGKYVRYEFALRLRENTAHLTVHLFGTALPFQFTFPKPAKPYPRVSINFGGFQYPLNEFMWGFDTYAHKKAKADAAVSLAKLSSVL